MFPAGYSGDALVEKTCAFLLSVSDEGTEEERFWVTCLGTSGALMAGDAYYTVDAAKRFPSQEFDISIRDDNWSRFTPASTIAKFELAKVEDSPYGLGGYYCDKNKLQVVLPLRDRYVDELRGLYILGHAGCDGIEFVLKPADECVYACYPIDEELRPVAPDFPAFVEGWSSGQISV